MYFTSLQFHCLCYRMEIHKRNLPWAGVFNLVSRDAKYSQFTSLNIMSFITFCVLTQFNKALIFPVSLYHNTSIPLGLVYFQYFCTLSKRFISSCSYFFQKTSATFLLHVPFWTWETFPEEYLQMGKIYAKFYVTIIGIFFELVKFHAVSQEESYYIHAFTRAINRSTQNSLNWENFYLI